VPLEPLITKHPSAIGCRTQFVDEAGIEGRPKQRTIRRLTVRRRSPEPLIEIVEGQNRIGRAGRKRAVARSAIIARMAQ
jgi:hypothetical protein